MKVNISFDDELFCTVSSEEHSLKVGCDNVVGCSIYSCENCIFDYRDYSIKELMEEGRLSEL